MSTKILSCQSEQEAQRSHRKLFASVVVVVILLGWKFPYLGLFVPIVMTTGFVGGLFRGRYVCGHLCPRGSFLDVWLAPFSGSKSVPAWIRTTTFRVAIVTGLMGFMGWRLSLDPVNVSHWGLVFWQMCLVTTLVAIAMGIHFKERAWCTVCPMGSIQATEGRGKYLLQIDEQCRSCHLCENVCPMDVELLAHRRDGQMHHPDCIKCGQCKTACPTGSLSWP
jgi:polyferredoxin